MSNDQLLPHEIAFEASGQFERNRCFLGVRIRKPVPIPPSGAIKLQRLMHVDALIDPGAEFSCVSLAVADELELEDRTPFKVEGIGVQDAWRAPLFIGFLRPDSSLLCEVIPVAITNCRQPFVLGMDIITRGDFSTTARTRRWRFALPKMMSPTCFVIQPGPSGQGGKPTTN